jgi:hypothetical protein
VDHRDWINFVELNRPALTEQLRALLPAEIEFSSIDPGPLPIIFLRRSHGAVELSFLAVSTELDEEGDLRRVEVVWPDEANADTA